MGKDQRSKHHGLDVRKNRKAKQQLQKTYDPKQGLAPQMPPKQHRGQR